MPHELNPLSTSIQFIKGVGPKLAELLSKKGIATIEDALYFIPRAYEDRRLVTPIAKLQPLQNATVFGKVIASKKIRGRGRGRSQFEATLSDGTGRLILFWFHAYPSLEEEFSVNSMFVVQGEVRFFNGVARITHPEYEKVNELKDGKLPASFSFGRVVPIYSETEGLHQKTIRRIMAEVLKSSLSHLQEPLPSELLQRLRLPSLRESFVAIHYPNEYPDGGKYSAAVKRIIFEEFFVLQLGLGLKKQEHQATRANPLTDSKGLSSKFISALPFQLTGDQRKVFSEIEKDLSSCRTMTRLVQGDVGSGKTVVAFAAGAIASSSGYQTALMVPTEILALQHFKMAQKFLEPLGIRVAMIVQGDGAKKESLKRVADGAVDFVVGTHALFQEAVQFSKLGLVVVDEQHRFGVEQRAELMRKGGSPHLLLMTATPIPRTLALTLYGDLDISVIREKPAGRKQVKTSILRDRERPKLYQKIRQVVTRGEQVYIIYPLVEASEKLDLKSATEMHAKLSREVFPDFSVTLLHGRMKSEDKERVLREFREKKFQILISTTVIEVGIDIPNATLMVIEHPERLGLSQLHQLRGRVGRGELPSECLLVADKFVSERLRVMEKTDDGFEIAEEDLKLRGPGEFLGTRQHGVPGFRVGHILRDAELLTLARAEALHILERDPSLQAPEHAGIRVMVESRWKEKIERLRGG